jgi:hypothetical protein
LEHYEAEGVEAAQKRLADLLDQVLICLETGRADAIIDWAARVGRERFTLGYDLFEVQTAMNVLEEALWRRIMSSLGPKDLGHGLGMANSILGMAKDKLAREYMSLSVNREAPPVSGR